MGQVGLFVRKNMEDSMFIIHRHIIYHSITNWLYFQRIKLSDPSSKSFLRKNRKKSKTALFAKAKCAPLKAPEDILTVNGICCKIFSQKISAFICIWFFYLVTKILLTNFLKKIQGYSGPRELSRDLFSKGG